MTDERTGNAPALAGGRIGLVLGLWLGVVDGARALYDRPALAGPFVDRLGTLGVAMFLDALACGALAAVLGLAIFPLFRGGPHGQRRFSPTIPALLAVAAAVGIASLGWRAPVPNATGRPNVVLISIDTLRADRLSAYGYERETSPHLSRLASDGVLFESAYAQSTWTLPAHASIFTGLDPFAHGVLREKDRLATQHVTLAEKLAAAGYNTAAWVGTNDFGYVGARHGFNQGFALYQHHPQPSRFRSATLAKRLDYWIREQVQRGLGNASVQVDAVAGWLRGHRSEPFFLFVHFYDVHSRFSGPAYRAPEPFFDRFCPGELSSYTGCREDRCASDLLRAIWQGSESPPKSAELAKLACLYDGAIAYVDHQIGRLLAVLDQQGLVDRTVVVVTADHGEAFFEHGLPLHTTLHEPVMRIPLIIRVPGGARGKRVHGTVGQIDLMPTLLELTDTSPAPAVQGTSLAGVLRSWPVEAGSSFIATNHGEQSTSLVRDGLKYIEHSSRDGAHAPSGEFYDLEGDVGETNNLASYRATQARNMAGELEARRRASKELFEHIVRGAPLPPVERSDAERAQLEALGYVE